MHKLIAPVFQPIVNQRGDVFAYEALMRFRGRPHVSPKKMVIHWERTGYIKSADLAMLRALGEILPAVGTTPRLAVNVSIRTVETVGAEYVRALIEIAPFVRRLIVELTETQPVSDPSALLRFHGLCREQGFAIALDDCRPGQPFGSASFIKTLRPQFIKLDGGHLQNCLDLHDFEWVQEVVSTAHQYEVAVIAEYVSSQSLRAFAFCVGADYVQGLGVGMPGPLKSINGNVYSLPIAAPIGLQNGDESLRVNDTSRLVQFGNER